jgi:hypothetical protein
MKHNQPTSNSTILVKVVLCSDDAPFRDMLFPSLQDAAVTACVNTGQHNLTLTFSNCASSDLVATVLRADDDVHCVLMDSVDEECAVRLVSLVNGVRPEVDVFVLVQQEDVVERVGESLVDGFFLRSETDSEGTVQ